MYTLEGSVANFITAYECSVFFVSKGNLFDVYLGGGVGGGGGGGA